MIQVSWYNLVDPSYRNRFWVRKKRSLNWSLTLPRVFIEIKGHLTPIRHLQPIFKFPPRSSTGQSHSRVPWNSFIHRKLGLELSNILKLSPHLLLSFSFLKESTFVVTFFPFKTRELPYNGGTLTYSSLCLLSRLFSLSILISSIYVHWKGIREW